MRVALLDEIGQRGEFRHVEEVFLLQDGIWPLLFCSRNIAAHRLKHARPLSGLGDAFAKILKAPKKFQETGLTADEEHEIHIT